MVTDSVGSLTLLQHNHSAEGRMSLAKGNPARTPLKSS